MTGHKTLFSLLEEEITVTIDSKLIKKIVHMQRSWLNRNDDHIEFMGHALLGTPPIKFTESDREVWFDDIIEVDDGYLKSEILDVPGMDPTHKVATDAFNVSCIYMVNKINSTKRLSEKDKARGTRAIITYMHYRFLTSLMFRRFPHEANRSVAEAAYAALSYRFALKVAGSWAKYIDTRADDILLDEKSIHRKTLYGTDIQKDARLQYACTNTQGAIRDVINNVVTVFYAVKDSGGGVNQRKNVMEGDDGTLVLKDVINVRASYDRYIHDVVAARDGFVRTELTSIVEEMQHTMPSTKLRSMLDYMANNYGNRGDKDIERLVTLSVRHAFIYIDQNKSHFRKGLRIAKLITMIHALYGSSRTTDPLVLEMRTLAYAIASRSIGSKSSSLISSVRTGGMLYLVLRTFTMEAYQAGGSMRVA